MVDLTPQYLPAMRALNNFYLMLYDALITAMPEAKFSKSGAYVWRGFRVDSYKSLATNQYYCQVDPDRPKMLVFKESFQVRGKYRDYIMAEVDLLDAGFFNGSCEEQQKFLVDFIAKAAQSSLIWQDSKDRLDAFVKFPKYLYGTNNFRQIFEEKYSVKKVQEDFIHAFPAQDQCFILLGRGIEKACGKVHLIPNAHWCNYDFRGYRMKFLDASGEPLPGPSKYVWRIYYQQPAHLTCERYNIKNYPNIPPFHLSQGFLSSSEEEQAESLYQFAIKSVQIH